MKKKTYRLCVYPKDIQRITGKGDRYSRELLHKIKKTVGKEPHQILSAEELSNYLGLPVESVREYMTDWIHANVAAIVSQITTKINSPIKKPLATRHQVFRKFKAYSTTNKRC